MHHEFADHDAILSAWMESNGWPVTMRHYDFDRDTLAWRSRAVKPAVTLRVSREVLEDHAPSAVGAALESLNVAAITIGRRGKSYIATFCLQERR